VQLVGAEVVGDAEDLFEDAAALARHLEMLAREVLAKETLSLGGLRRRPWLRVTSRFAGHLSLLGAGSSCNCDSVSG